MSEFLKSLGTGLVFFGALWLAFLFWQVIAAIAGILFTAYVGLFIREVVLTGGNPPVKDLRTHCEECGVPLPPRPPRDREVS